jgi:hypothetical protein
MLKIAKWVKGNFLTGFAVLKDAKSHVQQGYLVLLHPVVNADNFDRKQGGSMGNLDVTLPCQAEIGCELLFDVIPDFPELCQNGGFTFRVL